MQTKQTVSEPTWFKYASYGARVALIAALVVPGVSLAKFVIGTADCYVGATSQSDVRSCVNGLKYSLR